MASRPLQSRGQPAQQDTDWVLFRVVMPEVFGIMRGFKFKSVLFLSLKVRRGYIRKNLRKHAFSGLDQKLNFAESHILSTSWLISIFLENIYILWCFPRMF